MLQGELDSVDLAHVFQMLSINGKQGTLNIYHDGERRAILFTDRGVTLPNVQLPDEARILGILARLDRLPIEDLERVRGEVEDSPVAALEILNRLGLIDDEDIREVLRSQVEEEIYELFLWRKARFDFEENQFEDGLPEDPELYLNPNSLIMEAARRVDEWDVVKGQVRSDSTIYAVTDAGAVHLEAGELFDARDGYLMSLIDGTRNVRMLVEESGFERFYVCSFLHRMLADGWICELTEDELWAEGIAFADAGQAATSVALLERLLELGGGDADVHARLAEGCEQLGELAKASQQFKIYGSAREHVGDYVTARRIFDHVARLVPTDLEAQERSLINGTRIVQSEEEACQLVEEGKRLAELYSEIDQRERAIELIRTLIGLEPKSLELRRILVRLHRESGNARDVIKTYEEIARLHIENGDPSQAVLTYRNILALDRTRRDVASQIEHLRQKQHQKHSLRRTLRRVVVVLFFVGLVGAGYAFYEWKARRALASLEFEDLAGRGRFAEARQSLERFIAAYPFSLARLEANEGLSKIDRILDSQRDDVEARTEKREMLRLEQLRLAEESYQDGMHLLNRGRYDEALEKLFSTSQLEVGREWLEERRVSEKIADLTQIIRSARELRKRAQDLHAAGLFEPAYHAFQRLRTDFGSVSVAQDLAVPQRIVTVPSGARLVREDGEALDGVTPLVIDVPAERRTRLRIELDGHEPRWMEVDPDRDFVHRYVLERRALWRAHLPGPPVGSPQLDAGRLLVATRNGTLISLDTSDGSVTWETKLPDLGDIAAPPVLIAGELWVTTTEGGLYRVRTKDGQRSEREDFGAPLSQSLAAYGDTAYFGTTGGDLVALDVANGHERWRQRLSSAPVSEPVVDGQALFVRTRDGAIAELQAFTGKFLNRIDAGSGFSGELSLKDHQMFAANEDGFLYAVDTLSGRVIWKHRLDDLVRQRPVLVEGTIALTARQELRCLNARNGSDVWRFSAAESISAGPVHAEGRYYVGDTAGSVYSVRAEDGRLDWRCGGESPIRSVSVTPTRVFVSDASGGIRAFDRH